MSERQNGHFIVLLTEGDVIPANEIVARPDAIEIVASGIQTSVDPLQLKAIYELSVPSTPEQIMNTAATPEERECLCRALCGVIEVEGLVGDFLNQKSTSLASGLRLVLFGSTSLCLSVLPDRLSHDVDFACSHDFVAFCESRQRKSRGAVPEFVSSRILSYLGAWDERSSSITGMKGTEILLLHPLDTVTQKLLRIDPARFETNDRDDIARVLGRLRPSADLLLNLLTENPARYRIPQEKEQAAAVRRNTQWFLNEFLPELTYEGIVAESERREDAEMTRYGFRPLRDFGIKPGISLPLASILRVVTPPERSPKHENK